MREIADMGDLRSALYTDRDLSGIILDPEREEMWREYLRSVPTEVLATGVRWSAKGEEIRGIDVEEHDHVALRVCGIEWWRGDAGMEMLKWSCGPSWEVLHRYEDEYPGDMRPRDAILARWSYAHGRISREEWAAASSAAWSAAREAAWAAAWAAASSVSKEAAWDAARSAAWDAARSAAWDAAWSASKSAEREAAWSTASAAAWKRYQSTWDMWAVEVWR